MQPSDCGGIVSFTPVARGYHAIKQEEGKVRSVHKAQPFPRKPSIGCPVENPSSVREPGTQARTALQPSSVTLAGRRQLGLMKNGSCDIWFFAETDVFSQEAFFCPALKLIFSWILYTVPLLLCIH